MILFVVVGMIILAIFTIVLFALLISMIVPDFLEAIDQISEWKAKRAKRKKRKLEDDDGESRT